MAEKGNKRVLWTIILVAVLAVIALVIIFTTPQKEKEQKPDTLSVQCAFACESGQKTAFCDVERTLNNNQKATCKELSTNSAYASYNVQSCAAISCQPTTQEQDKTCVTGLNSTWATPTSEGACPEKEGFYARKRTAPSDNPPIAGQICCFYYK